MPTVDRQARSRRQKLKDRYGITPEEYDTILTSQGNRCACCRSPNPGHSRGWRVDHNHTTGKVRGIVCNACNLAIGFVREDPETLFQIAVYLRAHDK